MQKTVSFRPFASALAAGLLLLSGGCCCFKSECPAKQTAKSQVQCQQKNFFLPEHLYAVPGIECNIYFRNIFLAVNHAN